MTRWKVWAAGLALFASGVAVGIFGLGALHGMRPRGPVPPQGPPVDMVMRHLSQELELDDAQRAKVRPLVEEMLSRLHVLHESVFPQEDAIVDDYSSRIDTLLTPEQQKRHSRLRERLRDMRRGEGGPPPPPMWEGGPPPPPPPPPGE